MTVHQTSRYRFFDTQQIEGQNNDIYLFHKIRRTTLKPKPSFRVYVTRAGDTYEKLASREYSDSRKWYLIADANPNIFFPLDLPVGIQIIIPDKTYSVIS